ncbi:MAG: hypothetical protein K0R84_2733 [Clostridia bacterium]|jgi:hypothetical protein|nr:hypothetical protein [Clostridia bacterium]
MSKTVVIMEAPDSITSINQISDEHQYFLGAFGEVIGMLKQVFPQGDFSDPTSIAVHMEQGNIKIDINKHTPVQNFIITSDGELPLGEIMKLCKKTGWRALDTDSGLFLDKVQAKETQRSKSWWRFWEK